VRALVITIVGPPFGALAVVALGFGYDVLARRHATRRAVLLAMIAVAADRHERPALRALEQPMIEHVLAGRQLVAFRLVPGEGAPVDAPSRDTESWELRPPGLRPFRRVARTS
jgi:hypothetical protein